MLALLPLFITNMIMRPNRPLTLVRAPSLTDEVKSFLAGALGLYKNASITPAIRKTSLQTMVKDMPLKVGSHTINTKTWYALVSSETLLRILDSMFEVFAPASAHLIDAYGGGEGEWLAKILYGLAFAHFPEVRSPLLFDLRLLNSHYFCRRRTPGRPSSGCSSRSWAADT